jgi:hypothetical protein
MVLAALLALALVAIPGIAGAQTTTAGWMGETPYQTTAATADELLDVNGITPGQALLNLIEAENAGEWEKIYDDLIAYTPSCYEFVRADLAYMAPEFEDFTIRQTNYIELDAGIKYARVLVSYTKTYTDRASGERVTITRTGDWMTVRCEDGVWKPTWAQGTPGSTTTEGKHPDLAVVLYDDLGPVYESVPLMTPFE